MSEDIASIRNELWGRMRKKSSRQNFVAAHLSTGISAQLLTMREARGWTQKQVGEKAGMAEARICVMENPAYEKFTLSTLKRLASAFDVALLVRFVPFSQFVDWIAELTPEKLNAVSFAEDRLIANGQITSLRAKGARLTARAARIFEAGQDQQELRLEQKNPERQELPSTGIKQPEQPKLEKTFFGAAA